MAVAPEYRPAMTFWGPIVASVGQHASTAELWAAIRASVVDTEGTVALPSLMAVNQLRSLAASMRNATDALASARAAEEQTGLPQAVTAGMMSEAPWSRPIDQMDIVSRYMVRFEAQGFGPGGQMFTQWLSARYQGVTMPATVGELVADLGAIGLSSNSLQQGEFAGIGDISIVPF